MKIYAFLRATNFTAKAVHKSTPLRQWQCDQMFK